MTAPSQKKSFSLPPDVANHLAAEPNASAYVTEAIRTRMRTEQVAAALADRGITVTQGGVAAAAARRAAVEAQWPQGRRAALRDKTREAAAHPLDYPPQASAA